MNISKVMSMVDDVKEKLTDAEYKNIVDELAKQKESEVTFYKIKYLRIYVTNGDITSCCGDQESPTCRWDILTGYFKPSSDIRLIDHMNGTCNVDIEDKFKGLALNGLRRSLDDEPDANGFEQIILLTLEKLTS